MIDTYSNKETKPNVETSGVFVLNVPALSPFFKHAMVFKHFNELEPGGFFEIINDHDPKPLYYQMIAELGSVVTWKYLQNGPEVWRVQIKKNEKDVGETVGEIAAKDLRKAEVFRKLGIDFCCGGKKSLQQACDEKGLSITDVKAALINPENASVQVLNFNDWEPSFLADYIYNQHHKYYYNEEPEITNLMTKVFNQHGSTVKGLAVLNKLYFTLKNELDAHFIKEEVVVFPFIRSLEIARNNNSDLPVQPSLTDPIQIMESEHEAAGDILAQMRKVTDNYTPRAEACNSFQLLYNKLESLEKDLHQHIHLENNILFPKALKLEKERRFYNNQPLPKI